MKDEYATRLGLAMRWDAVECCGRRMAFCEELRMRPWQGVDGETVVAGKCRTCGAMRKSVVEFDESGLAGLEASWRHDGADGGHETVVLRDGAYSCTCGQDGCGHVAASKRKA